MHDTSKKGAFEYNFLDMKFVCFTFASKTDCEISQFADHIPQQTIFCLHFWCWSEGFIFRGTHLHIVTVASGLCAIVSFSRMFFVENKDVKWRCITNTVWVWLGTDQFCGHIYTTTGTWSRKSYFFPGNLKIFPKPMIHRCHISIKSCWNPQTQNHEQSIWPQLQYRLRCPFKI